MQITEEISSRHFNDTEIPQYCSERLKIGQDTISEVPQIDGTSSYPPFTWIFSSDKFAEQVLPKGVEDGPIYHPSTIILTPQGRDLYRENQEIFRKVLTGNLLDAKADYLASGSEGDAFIIELHRNGVPNKYVLKLCKYPEQRSSHHTYFTPGIDQMNLLYRLHYLAQNPCYDPYTEIYRGLNVVLPVIATIDFTVSPYLENVVHVYDQEQGTRSLYYALNQPYSFSPTKNNILSRIINDLSDEDKALIYRKFETYFIKLSKQFNWHMKNWSWKYPLASPHIKPDLHAGNAFIKLEYLETLITQKGSIRSWEFSDISPFINIFEAGVGVLNLKRDEQ